MLARLLSLVLLCAPLACAPAAPAPTERPDIEGHAGDQP